MYETCRWLNSSFNWSFTCTRHVGAWLTGSPYSNWPLITQSSCIGEHVEIKVIGYDRNSNPGSFERPITDQHVFSVVCRYVTLLTCDTGFVMGRNFGIVLPGKEHNFFLNFLECWADIFYENRTTFFISLFKFIIREWQINAQFYDPWFFL
jgi:hypothetical protein